MELLYAAGPAFDIHIRSRASLTILPHPSQPAVQQMGSGWEPGSRRGPHSADGDTGLCLENNQSVDGDTGNCLENDDECNLKNQKHKTLCRKSTNKAVWIGNVRRT